MKEVKMIELSIERVAQIMHEETAKTEDRPTVFRGIYTRYMHLYESYFADIDALNDDKVAEFSNYHEETKSLIKHYYLDIPLDVFTHLRELDDTYTDKLLGSEWHKFLFDVYKDFEEKNKSENMSEETLKAEFSKQAVDAFYDSMDYIFRDELGTGSKVAESISGGLLKLLFGTN